MKYYVYEYFIVDTLEVFYVGKGTGNRRFETHNRSSYFMSVYNKYRCAVRIVKQGLTNEEACSEEIERIAEMKSIGWAKCNFTSGGTGFSEGYMNPIHHRISSPDYVNPFSVMKFDGNKNHFFGKKHSEKTIKRISESRKGKGARFGKDNPMFGKEGHKGEKNGMYGKKGFEHPHSKMYLITYQDGTTETLRYKECEKKFGIAFSRIFENGGILEYKKDTPNKRKYQGVKVERLK
jgi:hypothetical protein